jgi:hypothetical protein
MAKCGITLIEGVKHEDDFGFPESRVHCACGWKSKPYSSDSANRPSVIGKAIAQYVDHRMDVLTARFECHTHYEGNQ